MAYRALLFLAAPLALGACYDTATLTGPAAQTVVGALASGPHDHPINLRAVESDGSTHTVRLDPGTSVRFHLAGGATTTWADADDLEVGLDGIAVLQPPRPDTSGGGEPEAAPEAPVVACGGQFCERTMLPWSEIAAVDLKNFDGPETLLAVGGLVEVVAILAIFSDDHSDAVSSAAQAVTDVAVNGAINAAAANAPGGDPSGDVLLDQSAPGSVFTANARRKSESAFTVGEEAGVIQGGVSGAVDSIYAGVELGELFDLDLVATGIAPRFAALPMTWRDPSPGVPSSAAGLGGRVSFDLPVDPGRHLFLPLGIEGVRMQSLGGCLTLQYELDLRLKGDVRLGVRPYNWQWWSGTAGSARGGGWLNEATLRFLF